MSSNLDALAQNMSRLAGGKPNLGFMELKARDADAHHGQIERFMSRVLDVRKLPLPNTNLHSYYFHGLQLRICVNFLPNTNLHSYYIHGLELTV